MTDSSSFLPNQKAVTSDLMYGLKPSAANSRSFNCPVPPTNGQTFQPEGNIMFNIPSRKNCFLDGNQTYLKLTIRNADDVLINLDGCGSCVIKSITVYSGSNPIETINNYNVLFNSLIDLNMNLATRISTSAMYGTTADTTELRAGAEIGPIVATVSKQLTVCVPILSGIVGCLCEKMTPLGALIEDLRVEILLEKAFVAVCYLNETTAAVPWSIVSAELNLQIVELQDEGMRIVNSSTPMNETIYLHATGYKNHNSTLVVNTTGEQNLLIPVKCASLKSIFVCPRRSTEMNSAISYSIGSRINPNIEYYNFKVGGLQIPQKSITLKNYNTTGGYGQAYIECMKALHSLNNASYGSSINIVSYQKAETADTAVGDAGTYSGVAAAAVGALSHTNGFIIGQEFESFANRSDTILSGLNTLGSQVFFSPVISNAGIGAVSYVLDFFCYMDVIYVIENGLITSRY